MSLALSAGHLGQNLGNSGEPQGPDGCSGNAGWAPAGGSNHPASFGKVPEGRVGWVAPTLGHSTLFPRWVKCGSGSGFCSQFSLAFVKPAPEDTPSLTSLWKPGSRAKDWTDWFFWRCVLLTSGLQREWGSPSLELLNKIANCGLSRGT